MAELERGSGVTFVPLAIPRRIAIAGDIRALVGLWRLFRRERFDLVQSITPKAGLLAMVAAWAAGAPVRVHWFVGQVWATKRGVARWILKTLDRVTAGCSTHLLADSVSQRAFLVAERVAPEGQITVLGHGSVCGVDIERFHPDATARTRIRAQYGIPADAVVSLYLGRLNREKGLPELAEAAARAGRRCARLHLLIVGPDEGEMRESLEHTLAEMASRVTFVGFTPHPEAFMAAADIFLLPSHREGFGATVIEAAACGTPTIGTRIYGLTDAVADGETGMLVSVRDSTALADAIIRLVEDDRLRVAMGDAARRRVERCFTQAHLTTAAAAYYDRLLRT